MGRALVLNATDSPLAVVPARRAVVLVLKEKAEVVVVQRDGVPLRADRDRGALGRAPAPVRAGARTGLTPRSRAGRSSPVTAGRCQYCGAAAENLDHVIPRSRGGQHIWENVVAACRRCNAKKENRTPAEAGFHLPRQPFAPRDGFRLTLGRLEPGWEHYLL